MVKNRELNWIYKYEQIQLFREIFGHCVIPQRYSNDPTLGSWVSTQRFFLKNLRLNFGRNALLKKLEFSLLSPKNFYFLSLWNKHYLELCYYKKVYGHCNVPGKFSCNNSLGFWVKNQRQLLKKNSLDMNKVGLLYQIGFESKRRRNVIRIPWLVRYCELLNYLKTYGTIKVPQRRGSLGKWVQHQRDYFKGGCIKSKKASLFLIIKFFLKSFNKQKMRSSFYRILRGFLFKILF
jgi:hypothetical protein|mmetsp:Transcript_97035/g.141981  ORF Transcript_97035/g.141981 Transcript_97035/m.141981 type:complete len:235 (+) Transcript_97035:67-771(+)